MHKQPIKYISFLMISLMVSSCASDHKPPKESDESGEKIDVQIIVSPDVNPNIVGQPSPIRLDLYQLSSDGEFKKSNYFELTNNAKENLGEKLIQQNQFMLHPDTVTILPIKMDSHLKYLGVVASYRDLDNSQWQLVLLKQKKRWYQFGKHYFYVNVGKNKLTQLSKSEMKDVLKEYKERHPDDKKIKENVDIICFPELATIGYTITADELQNLPKDFENTFIEKLQEKAKLFKIHILVGYLESKTTKKSRDFYNSCIFIDDTGKILANARKVYLWKKEKTKFKAGNKFVVKNTKFGKIGILLCYDLEFPEPARIECLKGAEIIFVPSLWSFSAENRWHIDLAANSLFNLLFIAGCNAVGDSCCGKSKIVEPDGTILIEASGTKEELLLATIDLAKLDEIRAKIPYLSDFKSDTFSIEALKKY